MNRLRFRHHFCFGIVAAVLVLSVPRINAAQVDQRVYAPLVMMGAANPLPNTLPNLLSPEEQDVLTLTNQLRAAAGCAPLTANAKLQVATERHSADMALKNDPINISHTGSDGSTPSGRAVDAGYSELVGENIASGYPTAAAVFEGWRTSTKGHYENLINCTYRDIGISLVRSTDGWPYWTQDFGIPR